MSNIMFGFTVRLSFDCLALFHYRYGIFLEYSSFYVFLLICKISMIFSIKPIKCLLSKRCCANFDFLFPYS